VAAAARGGGGGARGAEGGGPGQAERRDEERLARRYGAWYIPPAKWTVGMMSVVNEMASRRDGSWGREMVRVKRESEEHQAVIPGLFIGKTFKRDLAAGGFRVPHFLNGVTIADGGQPGRENGEGGEDVAATAVAGGEEGGGGTVAAGGSDVPAPASGLGETNGKPIVPPGVLTGAAG